MNPLTTTESSIDETASPTRNVKTLHRIRLAGAVFWTLAIMVLCWLSPGWVEELEQKTPGWFAFPDLDKVVHWGIFCIFALLWLRTSESRRRFWMVALGGLALAVITEVGQNLPFIRRDGNVPDAIADVIGVLIGLAIAVPVEPLWRFAESRLLGKLVPGSSSNLAVSGSATDSLR